jgi:uncharacterized linocin/CFP29 family protein
MTVKISKSSGKSYDNPEQFFGQYGTLGGLGGNDLTVNSDGLVNNSKLSLDEHEYLDSTIVESALPEINAMADLYTYNLVSKLPHVGVTTSMYPVASGMSRATVSMDGMAMGQKDRLVFDKVGVPVPVISEPWSINFRDLASYRNGNIQLDIATGKTAARMVVQEVESMLFLGSSIVESGNKLHGYITHPNRTTVELSGLGWAVNNANRDIVSDVSKLLEVASNNGKYGPFVLYVSSDVDRELSLDYKEMATQTFKDRIFSFSPIERIRSTRYLPSNSVVLVEMQDTSVDLVEGQDITTVDYDSNQFELNMITYCIMAPRIKVDEKGNTGVIQGVVAG